MVSTRTHKPTPGSAELPGVFNISAASPISTQLEHGGYQNAH